MRMQDDTSGDGERSVALDLRRATDVRGVWPAHSDTVTVEVTTPTGEGRLIVPVADVQRLVALLLLLTRSQDQADAAAEGAHVADLSVVPTTSLSVGEMPDGDTLLVIAVGAAMLGFSLPPEAATRLGRSLLLAGTAEAAGN